MQAAYDRCGLPTGYSILELCPLNKHIEREVYWIKETEAIDFGLNISYGGEDILVGEDSPTSKYPNSDILKVFRYLVYQPEITLKDVSKHTEVSYNVVRDISAGTKHLWLKELYPEEYKILENNHGIRKSHSINNLTDKFQFKRKLEVYPSVISPEGLVYNVDNLSAFAREHCLQLGNLSSLLNGKRKSHKGWKLAE